MIQLCQKLYDQNFTNTDKEITTQQSIFGTPQSTTQTTTQQSIFGTPQSTTQTTTQQSIFGTPQSTTQTYTFGTNNPIPSTFPTIQKSTFKNPEITLSASMFVKPPPFLSRNTFK